MHAYSTSHIHSETVCKAFAEGAGIPLLLASEGLKPGGVFVYGNLRSGKKLLDDAIDAGRTFYFADNGYFRPSNHGKQQYDGYYRISKNSFQHDGTGNATPERWARLGKRIMPWKKNGQSIMVCPPGDVYAGLHGFNNEQWLASVTRQIKAVSDRPLIVRRKPKRGDVGESLWDSLRDCHALVTHSSNSAVEALLFGVPIFATGACAALSMGTSDLKSIETPRYPDDRERWASVLANNQWTLAEFRDGTCWAQLNRE